MSSVYSKLLTTISSASVCAGMFWAGQAFSQPIQNDHPTFLFAPGSMMTLGKGFDIQNPAEERQICGTFDRVRSEDRAALNTQMNAYFVSNTRDLKRSLGIDLRMEARILFFSTQATLNTNNSLEVRENSISFVLSAHTDYGRLMASNFTLYPRFQEMLRAPGGVERFRATCGTHFVTTEFRGDTAAIVITLEDVTQDERNSIRASLQGGASFGIGSGSVSGSMESIVQSHLQNRRFTYNVYSTGGAGTSSLSGIASSAFDNNPTLGGLRDGLQRFMQGFTFDAASPIRFVSSPFVELNNRIENIEDIAREDSILDLADAFRTYRQDYRFLRDAFSRRRTEESEEFLRSLPATLAREVIPELPLVNQYLANLAAGYHRCLAAPIEQVATQCQLPSAPAAPNFESIMAIRAISRFGLQHRN